MIILSKGDLQLKDLRSSKGNQLKWKKDGKWYKADYAGYEGLAEYVVSKLLAKSTLPSDGFVTYDPEQIRYESQIFNGVSSDDFLEEGWSLITLERFFKSVFGQSLNSIIYKTEDHKERLKLLVNMTERATGIEGFGIYMSKILTIDTFFLNEDRHTHNIAILTKDEEYSLCPVFDQGAALLSDTSLDYPLSQDVYGLMKKCKPKTFCQDFDEQLDIAESLYGEQIKFHFTHADVDEALKALTEDMYSEEVVSRVRTIIFEQMRKYGYLFKSSNK